MQLLLLGAFLRFFYIGCFLFRQSYYFLVRLVQRLDRHFGSAGVADFGLSLAIVDQAAVHFAGRAEECPGIR